MLVRAEEVIKAEMETCDQKDDVFPRISKEEYARHYHLMEQLYGYELSSAEINDRMVTHVLEEFKDYLQAKPREEDVAILSSALLRLQAEKEKCDAAVADDLEFALLDASMAIRGLGTEFFRDAHLTQHELATKAGTTQPVIARLESGTDTRIPSLNLLARIASASHARLHLGFDKI